MALCDQLEASLTATAATHRRVLLISSRRWGQRLRRRRPRDPASRIESTDFWVKVVEMLQQNWGAD